jgi:UDP:flavonoid glycosyltransferase YjiC (YdhE family)
VIPHPPDWDRDVHVTGYFYADTEAEWSPSPELRAFLDGGQPPVYVGFGSMAGRDNEQVTAMVLAALEKTRQRGLLLTGWGGIRAISVPDGVFVLDSAPHSWLFPRMAAVMHHGGAGTTAEGLRAGIPSIIIPFAVDQPFWGKRVHDLGIGPAPIPRKKLTVEKLVQAIQSACAQPEMKQRATALGTVIRAERGVDNAVKFIGQHLEG